MAALELKATGDEIKQSEPCGAVDLGKALIDIPSPVSGTIVSVNRKVIDNPNLVKKIPLATAGW